MRNKVVARVRQAVRSRFQISAEGSTDTCRDGQSENESTDERNESDDTKDDGADNRPADPSAELDIASVTPTSDEHANAIARGNQSQKRQDGDGHGQGETERDSEDRCEQQTCEDRREQKAGNTAPQIRPRVIPKPVGRIRHQAWKDQLDNGDKQQHGDRPGEQKQKAESQHGVGHQREFGCVDLDASDLSFDGRAVGDFRLGPAAVDQITGNAGARRDHDSLGKEIGFAIDLAGDRNASRGGTQASPDAPFHVDRFRGQTCIATDDAIRRNPHRARGRDKVILDDASDVDRAGCRDHIGPLSRRADRRHSRQRSRLLPWRHRT